MEWNNWTDWITFESWISQNQIPIFLRYENIQQEFDALMQNYGLPIRMMKKSSKTVFHYAHGGKREGASSSSSGNQITVTDISLENLERINRIYDRDFRLFEYSKLTSRSSSPAWPERGGKIFVQL